MILFLNDWKRYPKAIADTQTTNESFLHLSALYRKMGIKNYLFPLSLLQPELQGVDPFAKDLTNDMKMRIAAECRWNPWYAIREIMRLPAQGGDKPIRFKINRGNAALIFAYYNHVDICLIQPRQTGKSASTDVLSNIILHLQGVNSTIQLITKDGELRKENIARLKGISELLPGYLNPINPKDADNKESITCVTRGNKYLTAVGQASKVAADNLGRGMTAGTLHIDEGPYIYNIHISYPTAAAATTAARKNAKDAGGVYGTVITTTAGKRDSPEGKFIYGLLADGMYWNEKLLDSDNNEQLIKMILRNSVSESPFINATFSHRQLGYTDEWLRIEAAKTRGTVESINRDFLNMWSMGKESSPFTIDIINTIVESEIDPIHIELADAEYMLKWYIPFDSIAAIMERGQFILSLDSSNAVGKDNNGIIITDASTMAVIAAASISEANLYRFAVWIAMLLVRYDNLMFVIENKSSGQAIIDIVITTLLKYNIDPFKRIYNRLVENIGEYPQEERMLNMPLHKREEHFYLRNKAKFGFNTNGNSRAHLYSTVLQHAVNISAHLIRDKTLSEELRGLVEKNGRVDHGSGGHDDSVIAWLLAHYFAGFTKNLSFYDVKYSLIMSDVSEKGSAESETEKLCRLKQKQLRLEIEHIKNNLNVLPTVYAKARATERLEKLIKESEIDGGAPISLDAVLSEVKKKGKSKNSLWKKMRKLNKQY